MVHPQEPGLPVVGIAPVQDAIAASDAQRTTQTVTYEVVQGPSSAAIVATIARPLADDSLRFAVDLPDGFVLHPVEDGSIDIVGPDGLARSGFDAPWARDAEGRDIATSYAVDGTTIVQHLEVPADAVYPLEADPKHTWGWVTGTAYYNRPETRSLKTRSYAYVVAAGLCAAFGTQTAGAACAIGAAVALQWTFVANNAYGDGKCVKIKVPTFWASAYSGGYCTK